MGGQLGGSQSSVDLGIWGEGAAIRALRCVYAMQLRRRTSDVW